MWTRAEKVIISKESCGPEPRHFFAKNDVDQSWLREFSFAKNDVDQSWEGFFSKEKCETEPRQIFFAKNDMDQS